MVTTRTTCEDDSAVKAIWNDDLTQTFCELCVKEVDAGNRPTTHLNAKGWENVTVSFQAKTGKNYGKPQLKNRWDTLKKEWRLWNDLIQKANGLGWCPRKRTIDASEEWWAQKIRESPAVKVFKKRGIDPELNEMLLRMFGDIVATGSHAGVPSSSVLPGGVSMEDATPIGGYGDSDENGCQDETANDIDLVGQESAGGGKDKGKEKLAPRKMIGKKMASQIDKLCDSMSCPRKNLSTSVLSPSRYGVEEAIVALRAMQHEVPKKTSMYYFALELFHHQVKREIFLSLEADERFWWLEREYEKHQANARYFPLLATPPCGFQPFQQTPPP